MSKLCAQPQLTKKMSYASAVRVDANKNTPQTRPISKPTLKVSPTVNVKNSEETLTKWKTGINFRNTNFSLSGVKLCSIKQQNYCRI